MQANFEQAQTTASQVVDMSFDNAEALILLLILCMLPQHSHCLNNESYRDLSRQICTIEYRRERLR